ncbi:MAG: hypothetical protein AAGA68_19395 [Pseudomonadota bacterium]
MHSTDHTHKATPHATITTMPRSMPRRTRQPVTAPNSGTAYERKAILSLLQSAVADIDGWHGVDKDDYLGSAARLGSDLQFDLARIAALGAALRCALPSVAPARISYCVLAAYDRDASLHALANALSGIAGRALTPAQTLRHPTPAPAVAG